MSILYKNEIKKLIEFISINILYMMSDKEKTLVNNRRALNWNIPIENRHVVPEFEKAYLINAFYNNSTPLGVNLPSNPENYGFIRDVYNNNDKLLQDIQEYKLIAEEREKGDAGSGVKTLFAVERLFEVLADRIKEVEEKSKMIETLERRISELEKAKQPSLELERGDSGVWNGGKKYSSRKTRKNKKKQNK